MHGHCDWLGVEHQEPTYRSCGRGLHISAYWSGHGEIGMYIWSAMLVPITTLTVSLPPKYPELPQFGVSENWVSVAASLAYSSRGRPRREMYQILAGISRESEKHCSTLAVVLRYQSFR